MVPVFYSFELLSRVSDFQKIFPKAKDVIAQAELVKDDIVVYNRKIVQLNAELETIPERCPLEVSVMCQMISGNKLQAENHTYLVRYLLINNNIVFFYNQCWEIKVCESSSYLDKPLQAIYVIFQDKSNACSDKFI